MQHINICNICLNILTFVTFVYAPKFIYLITQKVYVSIKLNNISCDSKFHAVYLKKYLL